MSTVRFAAVLRAAVGGAREAEVAGTTVGETFGALAETHPALGDQMFTADRDLNRFVNVSLNGQDVRYLAGPATPVGDGDEIRLLPAMAGGRRPFPDLAAARTRWMTTSRVG